jgi:Transglutaminase-like superfamily/Coenzyme PQQ synthesis protein D (PqqD)
MRTEPDIRPARFSIASSVYFSPATKEGCIVLNLERGTVLSLNDMGTLMFSKLAERQEGLTRAELVEAMRSEFSDVEPSRIEKAVDDLLSQLEKTGTLSSHRSDHDVTRRSFRERLAQRVPILIRYLLGPILLIKAYTVAALILLFSAEAVRKLGGFRSIHQSVEQWTLSLNGEASDETLADACSAVNRACTWHPKRSLCLQRASVLVCLLRSLGFQAEMVIGVHKMPFYGHAWAEVGGQVVNDHANAQKFFHVLSRC